MYVIKVTLNQFDTKILFSLIDQNQKELLSLQIKAIDYASPLLKTRIKEIKQTIDITKKIIIGRYKKENISLHKMIKMLLNSTNLVEEEIFKELITDRLIEKEEPVSMDLLIQVMDSLELEQLMMIIHSKENTFYGDMALSSYDKKCMEVDNDVYQELVLKLKQDMEEY